MTESLKFHSHFEELHDVRNLTEQVITIIKHLSRGIFTLSRKKSQDLFKIFLFSCFGIIQLFSHLL